MPKQIIIGLILFYLMYSVYKRKYDLFQVIIFLLPFHAISFNIGVSLQAFQVVIAFLLISSTIKTTNNRINIFFVGNHYVYLFLFYIFIITIVNSLFIEKFMNLGGYFHSEGRYISQLISYLLLFSMIPLAFNYIKVPEDGLKYIRVYLLSLLVISFLGLIQFLIYNFTGDDIFPLVVLNDKSISAIYTSGGLDIFRLTSLAGEPRDLSVLMVLGFFILYINNKLSINIFQYDTLVLIIYFIVLLLTLSTSGYVLMAVLFIITNIFLFYNLLLFKINKNKVIGVFLIFLIATVLVLYNYDFIEKIFQLRVLGRSVGHEDFDAPILKFLLTNPEYSVVGTGLGNIHNFAYPYISYENLIYMHNSLFYAVSGYLRLISETGFIGLSLFILFIFITYRRLSYFEGFQNKRLGLALQGVLLIILFSYLARTFAFNSFVTLFSIINAIAYTNRITSKYEN